MSYVLFRWTRSRSVQLGGWRLAPFEKGDDVTFNCEISSAEYPPFKICANLAFNLLMLKEKQDTVWGKWAK